MKSVFVASSPSTQH